MCIMLKLNASIQTMHVPSKTRIVISDKPLTSIAKKQTSVLLPQQHNQTITPTHSFFNFLFSFCEVHQHIC